MRVTVERLPGSAVTLEIAADDDEYKVAYDKTVRDLGREASIPGFRKGKAPRHMLERMVGREALVQETNRDLMEELFRKAVDQESLVPVSQPEVDVTQEDPLAFTVTVEVYPTATLGDYADVRVETREVDVTDEDVDTVVQEGRKSLAPWVSYETPRSPAEGDQIVIDMSVYDGDDLFMPLAVDETFVLGETPLFESIVEALKLMQPGSEGELTLAFEEDDATVGPELRGKTLRYQFALKDVRHRELPELDDEYARTNSSYDTLEEMVGRVRRDLLRARAGEERNEVVTEIIDAMTATAELEIPNGLVEREIDGDIEQTSARFAAQGLAYEDFLRVMQTTDEDYRAQLREGVELRLRRAIVLQEIAKAESIEVTDEDIEAEIDKVVGDAPNPERRRRLFSSDYFRDQLKNELFDRKLTERLIEIATEGRGAISGPGAELYEAGPEPPPPPRELATAVEVEAEGEVVEAAASVEAEDAPAAEATETPAEDSPADEQESDDEQETPETSTETQPDEAGDA